MYALKYALRFTQIGLSTKILLCKRRNQLPVSTVADISWIFNMYRIHTCNWF